MDEEKKAWIDAWKKTNPKKTGEVVSVWNNRAETAWEKSEKSLAGSPEYSGIGGVVRRVGEYVTRPFGGNAQKQAQALLDDLESLPAQATVSVDVPAQATISGAARTYTKQQAMRVLQALVQDEKGLPEWHNITWQDAFFAAVRKAITAAERTTLRREATDEQIGKAYSVPGEVLTKEEAIKLLEQLQAVAPTVDDRTLESLTDRTLGAIERAIEAGRIK